jgi:hypothetical protein
LLPLLRHQWQELAFWKAEEKSAREEEAQRSLLSPKAESKENPEDHSQVRMGHAPHLLAVLNNTALGVALTTR